MVNYKVLTVLHSGRRGLRGSPAKECLYLVGLKTCFIPYFDGWKQFTPISFKFCNDGNYSTTVNGNIIQWTKNWNNTTEIETLNYIYVLEEIDDTNQR